MAKIVRNTAIVGWSLVVWAGTSLAYDVTIDSFNFFVNTGPISSSFNIPMTASDTGLPGVLGGSRDLLAHAGVAQPLVTVGVKDPGLLDYMSLTVSSGFAEVSYTGDTAGLGRAIACAEAIEVSYLNADAAAQGAELGVDAALITLTLTGGVTVAASQSITAESGILTFSLADFAGVDLENLDSIALRIDGQSADLALDSIEAIGCEAPPSPAPAIGAASTAFSVIMLAGFGLLGLKRSRRA